jgi:hypothetical protein
MRQVRGLNSRSGPKTTRGSCIEAGQPLKPADPRKGKFQDRCRVSELGGVELIPAHSPQAKGRVERLFNTFQDRVIKEMRLADVSTLEAANQFLKGYLPIYNRRFAVRPAQAADLHRPCPAHRELDRILCLKTTRCLRKDFTIAYQG